MEEKSVYIQLVRTGTFLSRLIHVMTGDEYTHVAIGVESKDGTFYSFGRKYPRLPLPATFREECPWEFRHYAPCRIYRIDVSDACYDKICEILSEMSKTREQYHFNIMGIIAARFGLRMPITRRRHFFCSQFVAWLLAETGAIEVDKPFEFWRPVDFCHLSGVVLVYEGKPFCRVSEAMADAMR